MSSFTYPSAPTASPIFTMPDVVVHPPDDEPAFLAFAAADAQAYAVPGPCTPELATIASRLEAWQLSSSGDVHYSSSSSGGSGGEGNGNRGGRHGLGFFSSVPPPAPIDVNGSPDDSLDVVVEVVKVPRGTHSGSNSSPNLNAKHTGGGLGARLRSSLRVVSAGHYAKKAPYTRPADNKPTKSSVASVSDNAGRKSGEILRRTSNENTPPPPPPVQPIHPQLLPRRKLAMPPPVESERSKAAALEAQALQRSRSGRKLARPLSQLFSFGSSSSVGSSSGSGSGSISSVGSGSIASNIVAAAASESAVAPARSSLSIGSVPTSASDSSPAFRASLDVEPATATASVSAATAKRRFSFVNLQSLFAPPATTTTTSASMPVLASTSPASSTESGSSSFSSSSGSGSSATDTTTEPQTPVDADMSMNIDIDIDIPNLKTGATAGGDTSDDMLLLDFSLASIPPFVSVAGAQDGGLTARKGGGPLVGDGEGDLSFEMQLDSLHFDELSFDVDRFDISR